MDDRLIDRGRHLDDGRWTMGVWTADGGFLDRRPQTAFWTMDDRGADIPVRETRSEDIPVSEIWK